MGTSSIQIVLVDDEPFSRDELKYLLSNYPDVTIAGEAGSVDEALGVILSTEPDAIFLDIEMGERNGIELAAILNKLKKVPLIVFATAYPDYAVSAFRVQALDYVLKPFEEVQLHEAVKRIRSALPDEPSSGETYLQKNAEFSKLAVQQGETIHYLAPKAIDYIYREGQVTKVVSQNVEYLTRYPLKELAEKLQDHSFFRTHKGYIVNLNRVEEITPWFNGAYQLKLIDVKEQIPVSRNYVKPLRQRLEL
ncbi:LytR/AlgR family response regulator transcription factor [Salisediminibacterium beveridgei]|uniref:LytR/AlgR family DNA-binding response regulator n=1 Tax=Salisediminibacterium beveridgei TaxID=632773 RepID=A0A1D7QXX1_9BACI|nr:LytTR family DNA-binding domain-containing protein [Salisediminibacterium beveridgei]AOM83850.1 LytR/AlgR family DNA-binding response regulator [Salisediminibacterium beveridgei]